jgi:hypothetical protein
MSEPQFVKLIQSDEARRLIHTYPIAFLVLTLIALRLDSEGVAFIGQEELEGCGKGKGIGRKQVRTALKFLVDSKKAAIESTNKGTIVKLLDSKIYEKNKKRMGQQKGQQWASNGPLNKINISSAIATDISFNIARGASHIYQNFFSKDLTEDLKECGTFELSEEMCLKILEEAKKIHSDEKQAQDLMMSQIYRFSTFLVDKPKVAKARKPHLTILNWIRTSEKTEKKTFKHVKKAFTVDWEGNRKYSDELMRSLRTDPDVRRRIKGGVDSHAINLEVDGNKITLKYTENGYREQLESYLRKQQII